jgi:hypothetical protein
MSSWHFPPGGLDFSFLLVLLAYTLAQRLLLNIQIGMGLPMYARSFAALIAASCIVGGSSVRAVIVPVNFQGASQTFSATLDIAGDIVVVANGMAINPVTKTAEAFATIPPTSHPVKLSGAPVTISSQPKSVNFSGGAVNTSLEFVAGELTGISNLDVDILNGVIVPLAVETIEIPTTSKISLLKLITVDISEDVNTITFEQTDPAVFAPTGPGTGTFSIGGFQEVSGDQLNAVISGLIPLGIPLVVIPESSSVEGTYTVTGPKNNAKVSLDFTGTIAWQLFSETEEAFEFSFSSPLALTISASLGVPLTAAIHYTIHLEQDGLIIPEPGSATLLLLGMALVGGCLAQKRRRSGRRGIVVS